MAQPRAAMHTAISARASRAAGCRAATSCHGPESPSPGVGRARQLPGFTDAEGTVAGLWKGRGCPTQKPEWRRGCCLRPHAVKSEPLVNRSEAARKFRRSNEKNRRHCTPGKVSPWRDHRPPARHRPPRLLIMAGYWSPIRRRCHDTASQRIESVPRWSASPNRHRLRT
jgi:hypothetical protein